MLGPYEHFLKPNNMRKRIDFNTEDLESLTHSQLKRVTDYWLRQYLLSEADIRNGRIRCPIKGKWYPINKIQVCHYIDRATMCLRYDLTNCHLISEASNVWDARIAEEGYKSKHHKEYEEYLGEKNMEYLLDMSKKICIFAKEDYISKIKEFRNGTSV